MTENAIPTKLSPFGQTGIHRRRIEGNFRKTQATHRLLTALLLLLALPLAARAQNLLPYPQKITWGKGTVKATAITFLPLAESAEEGHATPEGYYRIHAAQDGVRVELTDSASRLHAEATLRQLQVRQGVYRCCEVEDWPQYRWRGAMIDVSRHFFPLPHLLKQVDILASYKINRLHLHLTDAAGWRMEIKRYPRLTQQAAYRTQSDWNAWWIGRDRRYLSTADSLQGYGGFYTQDEMRRLVAYAAARGITVVPEIEMPGHSEEVLHAYPELSCTHAEGAADFCPGNPATLTFLENVLREVMDVFPSDYIHVGGDEAGRADWPNCPLCRQKLREAGGTDFRDLQTQLIAHMGRFLEQHGRRLVGWDEVIDQGLHTGTTVMVWRGVEKAAEAARLGLDVVMSPGAYCYFDAYQDEPPTQPEGFGSYLPLEKAYSFDPLKGLSPAEAAHIVGVQGNLWTEYVPTAAHQEYMLYPRLLAVAEIGWGTSGRADFRERAARETDRLRAAGVNAFNLRTEQGERKGTDRPSRHKAVGARVSYATPPAPQYSGSGDGTLVDGYCGGWAFGDGRWQGFIRSDKADDVLDITLDLGTATKLREVTTTFRQDCCAEIYYPEHYRVSTSTDGLTWTELGSVSHPYRRTPTPDVLDFTVKGKARARYLRIRANAPASGGWLFTDEVAVK